MEKPEFKEMMPELMCMCVGNKNASQIFYGILKLQKLENFLKFTIVYNKDFTNPILQHSEHMAFLDVYRVSSKEPESWRLSQRPYPPVPRTGQSPCLSQFPISGWVNDNNINITGCFTVK